MKHMKYLKVYYFIAIPQMSPFLALSNHLMIDLEQTFNLSTRPVLCEWSARVFMEEVRLHLPCLVFTPAVKITVAYAKKTA